MKVKVSLDYMSQNKKLKNGYQIAASKRRACKNWMEIDIDKLADQVGNHGHSYVAGHLVGGIGAANCTEMQLFSLDFDSGATFQEIKQRCDLYGLSITFAYHTFSSSDKQEKFRIVFAHECMISDPYILDLMNNMLYRIFKGCDSQCKNLDRMYLGGKELICLNSNANFSLVQLFSIYKEIISRGGHYKENMDDLCKKCKILKVNGCPAIGTGYYLSSIMEQIGENLEPTAKIHEVGDSKNSQFFVIEESFHQTITRKVKPIKRPVAGDSCCQLLNDFNAGKELDHQARFAILTNLMNVDGGRKHFYQVLEDYYSLETVQKWKYDIQYIKGIPMRCSEDFCPYYDICGCRSTIYSALSDNAKITRLHEEEYVTVEEAYDHMKFDCLEDAMNRGCPGFYLIKAQTSLGKTRAYIDLVVKYLLKYPDKKFLIAVPTNRLKNQIYDDFVSTGMIDKAMIYKTLSIKDCVFIEGRIKDKIEEEYSAGMSGNVKTILREYIDETMKKEPNAFAFKEECDRILNGIREIKKERLIITTHAFMMHCPESFLKQYTVIIDEDILYMQIFNNSHEISIELLEKIVEQRIPGFSDIARQMLAVNENEYGRLVPMDGLKSLTEKQIRKNQLWCSSFNDLNDIALAGAFVKKQGTVKYFCPQTLPDLKYIVLSATLNEKLYRKYFGSRRYVYMYPEQKASYKGEVIQFPYHLLGRTSLEKHLNIFDLAREKAKSPGIPIITFKKFELQAQAEQHGMHFGNTTGINNLKGQSIVVIGTPYKAEEAYKLVACYLGANVNDPEDQRPTRRIVEYNGYSFPIVTYKNELLREIQLFSFESELEQAIGRARLLRYNCTAYVYSAFPCEQAKLHTENYLLNYKDVNSFVD